MNHLEEDTTPNQSIKSMLDSNKERKLIKVDFSALAHLVVCIYTFLLLILLLFIYGVLTFNLQSSDSEDDFEDDDDNKFKTTAVDFQDESTCLGISSQGSDSQPHNCDLHFQLKTLSPTSSCVIS